MEGIENMSLMDTRDYTTEQEIHHRQQDWTVNTSGCLKPEKACGHFLNFVQNLFLRQTNLIFLCAGDDCSFKQCNFEICEN